ncbi:hypothetical protein A2U01_0073136, partial [Trifolium medium]|nr:hypothetical protein [Trifolium medium]
MGSVLDDGLVPFFFRLRKDGPYYFCCHWNAGS